MKTFHNILVVVGPINSPAMLNFAIRLAQQHQARLTVAFQPYEELQSCDAKIHTIEDVSQLQQALALADMVDGKSSNLSRLDPARLVEMVLRGGHDLLIKQAEQPGFIASLLGGDDRTLLRQSPCPVWLTPSDPVSEPSRILVALDFDPENMDDARTVAINRRMLDVALGLAYRGQAELQLLHVWDAPAEMTITSWSDHPVEARMSYVEGVRYQNEKAMGRVIEGLRDRMRADGSHALQLQALLPRGEVCRCIAQQALDWPADLVIMGTMGRTGVAGWLIGNTVEETLGALPCSVLTVGLAGPDVHPSERPPAF